MQMRVHINLPVRDIGRTIGFYERLFGQAPSTVRDDYANFRLDAPALHLALVAHDGPTAGANQHFGVELFDHDTLAQLRERATSAGLTVRDETQIACCYAVGDKFWAADPDGHEWEFWVRTGASETLAPIPAGAEAEQSACCAPSAPPPKSGCCG